MDLIRSPTARRPGAALLELRTAVEGVRPDGQWDVSPVVAERIDDSAADWLLAVGPGVEVEFGLPVGGDIAIRPDQVRETLRAQRQFGGRCTITAVSGDRIRALNMHYRSAHLSLLAGIRCDVESFDYQSTLADLDQGLDRLASDIRNAFIRYTSDPGLSGAFAHADRELFRIVHRAPQPRRRTATGGNRPGRRPSHPLPPPPPRSTTGWLDECAVQPPLPRSGPRPGSLAHSTTHTTHPARGPRRPRRPARPARRWRCTRNLSAGPSLQAEVLHRRSA